MRPADRRRGLDPARAAPRSPSSIAASRWSTRRSCASCTATQLRKINQNGILPLIMAHLFSLPLIREIFGRQMQQGKVPEQLAGGWCPSAPAAPDAADSAPAA